MLEHSWRLICVIHKTSGGTAYTLKRAIRERKEIACISMENRDLLFQFAMHFLETGEEVPQTAAERFAYYHGHPERLRLCQSLLKGMRSGEPNRRACCYSSYHKKRKMQTKARCFSQKICMQITKNRMSSRQHAVRFFRKRAS